MEEKEKEAPKFRVPKIEVIRIEEGDNQLGLRVRVVSIKSESPRFRDNKKIFLITEKPAMEAELWAVKVLNILAASGVDIGGDALSLGMRGVALKGIQALGSLPMNLVEDLLHEMMACVRILPDFQRLPNESRAITGNDVQEVATLVLLKREVFDLHTDFLQPVDPSTLSQDPNLGSTVIGSPNIQTSQQASGRRSVRAV